MATRLYYVASSTPPVSPTPDAGWTSTTGMVRRLMATTQAAPTEQATVSYAATGPAYTATVQLVSPPLAAQTISGTVSVVSRGKESASTANVNKRARAVYVVTPAGAVRGVLNAWAATTSTTELSATTLQGQQHSNAAALTSLAVLDGDRIVVEVGYGVGTSGTTPQATMEWGGVGTDHANANSDATGTVPWVEFSANLVWQSTGPASVTLTPATAAFSAPAVSASGPPSTATLTPATAAFSARPVTPGGIPESVVLTPATAAFTARTVTPTAPPASVTLTPATASFTARALAPTGPPSSVVLTPATASFTARALAPAGIPSSVALVPAAGAFAAVPLAPTDLVARPLVSVGGADDPVGRVAGQSRTRGTVRGRPGTPGGLVGTHEQPSKVE